MIRPTRIEYEGALYHAMSRGVARAPVFLDDTDRREFLESLATLDSPLGKGHTLLFANNPIWRSSTQGSYALVFNAIFNRDALSTGWPPTDTAKEPQGADRAK